MCSGSTCLEKSKAEKRICLPLVDSSIRQIRIGTVKLDTSEIIQLLLGTVVVIACLGVSENRHIIWFMKVCMLEIRPSCEIPIKFEPILIYIFSNDIDSFIIKSLECYPRHPVITAIFFSILIYASLFIFFFQERFKVCPSSWKQSLRVK